MQMERKQEIMFISIESVENERKKRAQAIEFPPDQLRALCGPAKEVTYLCCASQHRLSYRHPLFVPPPLPSPGNENGEIWLRETLDHHRKMYFVRRYRAEALPSNLGLCGLRSSKSVKEHCFFHIHISAG